MAQDVLKARRAEARGLPAEVPIEAVKSLPFFGRTWYTRGTRYYLLRACATFVWLVTFGIYTGYEFALFHLAAETDSPVGRKILHDLLVVALIGSFVTPLIRTIKLERRRRAGELLAPAYYYSDNTGRLVWARAILHGLLGVLVVTLLFYGWFPVCLFLSLRRETDLEYDERLRLQDRARRNPEFTADEPPTKKPRHR